jgi:hypothetical protein
MQFARLKILLITILFVFYSNHVLAGTHNGDLFKEYMAMSKDYRARVGNSYLLKYFSRNAILIYADSSVINNIKEKHPEVFSSIDISEYLNSDYPFIAVKANQLANIKEHNEKVGKYNSCLSMLGISKKGKEVVLALQYVREDSNWKILKAFTGHAPETFRSYIKAPCSAFNQR